MSPCLLRGCAAATALTRNDREMGRDMHRSTYLLTLMFAACAAGSPPGDPATGQALYLSHCASCHGAGGRGDGSAGAALAPPPADLTQIAARRDGVWPMLEVMSIIDGYTQATDPRPGMPVVRALTEGERMAFDTGNGRVSTAPANLLAVARYLETIEDPPPDRYVP